MTIADPAPRPVDASANEKLVSQERHKYERMWTFEQYRGNRSNVVQADRFIELVSMAPGAIVLDIGCGPGYASRRFLEQHMRVVAIDIARNALDSDNDGAFEFICSSIWDLPETVSADYGFCTDAMEHIPPDKINDTLAAIRHAVRKDVYFEISLRHDSCGRLIDDVLHLTVKPLDWWLEHLRHHWPHVSIVSKDDIDMSAVFLASQSNASARSSAVDCISSRHTRSTKPRYSLPNQTLASRWLPKKGHILDTASALDLIYVSKLPARSVDAVVSLEALERAKDAVGLLQELRRVMKNTARIVAGVPYRQTTGSAPGVHTASYDARTLLALFSRFFIVDDMWWQATEGTQAGAKSPAWCRLSALGTEPDEPAQRLMISAKRADIRSPRRRTDWVFLTPGVPQLATMLAAMRQRRIKPERVAVWGCSSIADDGFHQAMREATKMFGARYKGNLFLAPDVNVAGDVLDYSPGNHHVRQKYADRLVEAYPILETLRGCRLMMPARPNVLSDYALLAAARPAELHLIADGIQNDLIVRDLTGMRGFADNALARIPTATSIGCPPWLRTEVEAIGRPAALPASLCRRVLARIGRVPSLASLRRELSDWQHPFSAVIVSQHLSLTGMTSADAENAFYVHQIRVLLQMTNGRVLFKAHPRDPHGKLDALALAVGKDIHRVRITHGVECHAPLEAFPTLGSGRPLIVWGTSSTALLGVRDWPSTTVSCVDADYLEGEVRRQALQFSRRHGLERVTLTFDDVHLSERECSMLRRRMIGIAHVPALSESLAWRHQVLTRWQAELENRDRRVSTLERQCERLKETGIEHLGRATARDLASKCIRVVVAVQSRRVVIWGAGAAGKRLMTHLGIRPRAIVDSDPAKADTTLENVPVVSPSSLKSPRLRNAFIIIASVHAKQIADQLMSAGRIEGTHFMVVGPDEFLVLESLKGLATPELLASTDSRSHGRKRRREYAINRAA